MNFADRYFADRIERWARARLDERIEQLANGMAADHADYRNRVGYVEALRDLLGQIETTERAMSPQRQENAA